MAPAAARQRSSSRDLAAAGAIALGVECSMCRQRLELWSMIYLQLYALVLDIKKRGCFRNSLGQAH